MLEYPWLDDEMLRTEATAKRTPTYPANHKAGMKVPEGGSMCGNCKHLKDEAKRLCGNEHFIRWNGSALIPAAVDEYCSDWYEAR